MVKSAVKRKSINQSMNESFFSCYHTLCLLGLFTSYIVLLIMQAGCAHFVSFVFASEMTYIG